MSENNDNTPLDPINAPQLHRGQDHRTRTVGGHSAKKMDVSLLHDSLITSVAALNKIQYKVVELEEQLERERQEIMSTSLAIQATEFPVLERQARLLLGNLPQFVIEGVMIHADRNGRYWDLSLHFDKVLVGLDPNEETWPDRQQDEVIKELHDKRPHERPECWLLLTAHRNDVFNAYRKSSHVELGGGWVLRRMGMAFFEQILPGTLLVDQILDPYTGHVSEPTFYHTELSFAKLTGKEQ